MWSPSQTEMWLTCPIKWAKHQAGELEQPSRWHPAQLVGTALHAGWGAYLDPTQVEKSIPRATTALIGALKLGWFEDAGDFAYEQVETVARKCLERVCIKDIPSLLDDHGSVVATECILGPGTKETGEYPGTADLITEHGPVEARYLVVTDYKTHWTVTQSAASRYQANTERSWQLVQYAYFAQQAFSRPVSYIRSVHVAVTPAPKAWMYTCPVSPARLEKWHQYAILMWETMSRARSRGDVWPNWDSCEKYGAAYRCGYYTDCHGD